MTRCWNGTRQPGESEWEMITTKTCILCGGTRGEHVGFDCPEDPTRPARDREMAVLLESDPQVIVSGGDPTRESVSDRELDALLSPQDGRKWEERSKVRDLYSYHQAAYGFIATSPEQVQHDGTWEGMPQVPFRPLLVVVWSVGRAWIESLKLGTVEQLLGGVPAQLFEVPLSPEKFLADWLGRPDRHAPLVQLIGARMKRRLPIDEGAPRWLYFPTVSVGSPMSARFKGELRGFLLLGHELDNVDPRDATGSAPAADL